MWKTSPTNYIHDTFLNCKFSLFLFSFRAMMILGKIFVTNNCEKNYWWYKNQWEVLSCTIYFLIFNLTQHIQKNTILTAARFRSNWLFFIIALESKKKICDWKAFESFQASSKIEQKNRDESKEIDEGNLTKKGSTQSTDDNKKWWWFCRKA